jgi:hypothetical protein
MYCMELLIVPVFSGIDSVTYSREVFMSRGGKRIGAGNRFKWNFGKTKVIRVPEAIAEQVLEYAHFLDSGGISSVTHSIGACYDSVTQSKDVDLSGVLIRSHSNQPAVLLADLVRIGYRILPDKLMQSHGLRSALENQSRVELIKKAVDNDFSEVILAYE